MLWLNKTGKCQPSIIYVIYMGLPKLLERFLLKISVLGAWGFTVF